MKYVLEARLGEGRTGEVFCAHLEGAAGFTRGLAVKRMSPGLAAQPDFARRFVAATRTASLLRHPNIVAIVDFDRDETGTFYLAMELVEGADLGRLIPRVEIDPGRFPPGAALHIAAEVLRGLAHAHAHALVHGELLPAHVLVDRGGAVKLAGFDRLDRSEHEDRRVDLVAVASLVRLLLPVPSADLRAWLERRFASAAEGLAALTACPSYPADGASELARLVDAALPANAPLAMAATLPVAAAGLAANPEVLVPRRRAQNTTLTSAAGAMTVKQAPPRSRAALAFLAAAALGTAVGWFAPADVLVFEPAAAPNDAGVDAMATDSR